MLKDTFGEMQHDVSLASGQNSWSTVLFNLFKNIYNNVSIVYYLKHIVIAGICTSRE